MNRVLADVRMANQDPSTYHPANKNDAISREI